MQCVRTVLRAKRLPRGLWLRDGVDIRHRSSTGDSKPLDLEQALEQLAKACVPTQSDHDVRERIIHDIQKSLRRMPKGSGLRIVPFGSFVSSFYDARSDLDLALCGTVPAHDGAKAGEEDPSPSPATTPVSKLGRAKGADLLRSACAQLIADGLVSRSDVEFILHARIPLVKFTERCSGIEVDLCLGQDAIAFKAWSVAQVASIHPAFGKLFRVVKVWAKAHAINDGAAHMFNSWCLTLVVMFFLQRHCRPPLLPPLHSLLCDKPPRARAPRLMQMGASPQPQHLQAMREAMERRVAAAQAQYGSLPSPPLDQLFADFVDSSGTLLRALLQGKEPFTGQHGISVFYGDYQPRKQLQQLFVEDPYDSGDNTARTLPRPLQWNRKPTTLDYVASVFSRTARRLGRQPQVEREQHEHLSSEQLQQEHEYQQQPPPANEAADPAAQGQPLKCYLTTTKSPVQKVELAEGSKATPDASLSAAATQLPGAAANLPDAAHRGLLPPADVVSSEGATATTSSQGNTPAADHGREISPPSAPCLTPPEGTYDWAASTSALLPSSSSSASFSSSSPPCPFLASTLVFMFGPELLSRLPALSRRLLGPDLEQWARGALAAGRPAGEVHTGMLQRLGAAGHFEHFHFYKRRHSIRVMNEFKWVTPEEKEQAAERAAEQAVKRAARQQKAASRAPDAQAAKAAAATGTEKEAIAVSAAAEVHQVSRPLHEQVEEVAAAEHLVPLGSREVVERRRVVPKKKRVDKAAAKVAEESDPAVGPAKLPRARSRPGTHRPNPTSTSPTAARRASTPAPTTTITPPSPPSGTPPPPASGSATSASLSSPRPVPPHTSPHASSHKPGRGSSNKSGGSSTSHDNSGAATSHRGYKPAGSNTSASTSKAGGSQATNSSRKSDSADSKAVTNKVTLSTVSNTPRTSATGTVVRASTTERTSNNVSADDSSGSSSRPADSARGPRTRSPTRKATHVTRSRTASRAGPPRPPGGTRGGESPAAT